MNQAPSPDPTVSPAPGGRMPVVWHLAWGLGVAGLLVAAGAGAVPAGGFVQAGMAFALVPALVGQALWREPGGSLRLILVAAWSLSMALAVALSGGISGPLAVWSVAPLIAGLVFGGPRERALGAAGSVIAVAVGLAASVRASIDPLPLLSSLATLLLIGTGGWSLLTTFGRRDAREVEGQSLRRRLEHILQAQPLLSLRLDADGGVHAAFGRAQPGLPLETLTADGLVGVAQPADQPGVRAALGSAASGQEGRATFHPGRALDRQYEVVIRPLDGEGLLAVVRDVSDQQAREAALEAARFEAETLHQGKTRFLANMSHELRTPLNAVLGFSDMMRQRMFGPLPERYLEYANLIHEAGGHLLDLINDVLDMSKIEAERFELARERFDAREPVSAALRLIRLQAHDKGVDLHAALPADPVTVEADKRALKQMALNLLSNAVKFTPRHGSVTLTLEPRGEVLEVSVADTGVGLSPTDLERIGRPYEQAGGADQRNRGTGLGLSLVRSMAELHGGQLTIESTLGEGSIFTLRLPVVDEQRRGSGEVVPFPAPAPAGGEPG